MNDLHGEWTRKGATLSDTAAKKEFGLSDEEVIRAIRSGAIQCRKSSMHGNPWLRLLRREVEALVAQTRGKDYLKDLRAKNELASINRELKRLKAQIVELDKRKAKLLAG